MDDDAVIAEALREVPAKKPKVRPIRRRQYAHPKKLREPARPKYDFYVLYAGHWLPRQPWPVSTPRYTPHQGAREQERRRRQMAKQKA